MRSYGLRVWLVLCRWNNLSLAYTETLGLPALREEIAAQYADDIDPSNLVVLAPEEGIFLAMTAILRAGDHVVCTAPGELQNCLLFSCQRLLVFSHSCRGRH